MEVIKRKADILSIEKGRTGWRSPSNIALVKYWGKKPVQIPMNPSLSFTLQNSYTETYLTYSKKNITDKPEIEFLFEGKENIAFQKNVETYFKILTEEYPILKSFKFNIESRNSFPHSAGIASSASAMSSLALCIANFLEECNAIDSMNIELVSRLARLGSGSACRSVYAHSSFWGKSKLIPESSDEFAVGIKHLVHQNFLNINDSILIVDSSRKKVSSRIGHELMIEHPFRSARIKQAAKNLDEVYSAMVSGDWEKFIRFTELEALSLHSLMMSSNPPFILMLPSSLQIIQKVMDFRNNSGLPVGFTLDAGPNVHLIYPQENEEEIRDFIGSELLEYCENNKVIHDKAGEGPVCIA